MLGQYRHALCQHRTPYTDMRYVSTAHYTLGPYRHALCQYCTLYARPVPTCAMSVPHITKHTLGPYRTWHSIGYARTGHSTAYAIPVGASHLSCSLPFR
eukprot:3758198-Rhodomonas_salina.1